MSQTLFYDRATLWNSVEMCEKRRDSHLARDIEVSLPKELPLSEHKKIMQDYSASLLMPECVWILIFMTRMMAIRTAISC